MDSDNVYPNNGEYFIPREPQEMRVERQKEKAKVLEAKKLSEEILDRYDDRIAFYDSVDSIDASIRSNEEKFLRAWVVNREVKSILQAERDWLEGLIEPYKR